MSCNIWNATDEWRVTVATYAPSANDRCTKTTKQHMHVNTVRKCFQDAKTMAPFAYMCILYVRTRSLERSDSFFFSLFEFFAFDLGGPLKISILQWFQLCRENIISCVDARRRISTHIFFISFCHSYSHSTHTHTHSTPRARCVDAVHSCFYLRFFFLALFALYIFKYTD